MAFNWSSIYSMCHRLCPWIISGAAKDVWTCVHVIPWKTCGSSKIMCIHQRYVLSWMACGATNNVFCRVQFVFSPAPNLCSRSVTIIMATSRIKCQI